MAIGFSCPSCDRVYSVSDQYARKVTTCKDCDTRMVVPDAEGTPAPPRPRNPAARDAGRFYEEAVKEQRRRDRQDRERERASGPRFGVAISPAVVTTLIGAALIAVGVAWFAVCILLFGVATLRVPLIFMVFGLISLLKGLMGHEG